MIEAGTEAPDFELASDEGSAVRLTLSTRAACGR